MNIDWSKAPEWAVAHGLEATGLGIKEFWLGETQHQQLEHAKAFPYGGGDPSRDSFHNSRRSSFSYVTERPAAWTGEGLPPVGTVCEIRSHKLSDWSPATIKFASRNVVVWDWEAEPALNGLCAAYAHAVEIRPIRTPEQIAAEEHQAAIEELAADTDWILTKEACEAVLAAGYRKQMIDD